LVKAVKNLKMSRIGKLPILIPETVKVTLEKGTVKAVGPKGENFLTIPEELGIEIKGNVLEVKNKAATKESLALWGTYRSLIFNMVKGAFEGFSKTLELVGVGYRASKIGNTVTLALGYSHLVVVTPPEGITLSVPEQTKIVVFGIDKGLVGQTAADIRKLRKPEPYKGKGIRYEGEIVKRKAGKTGKVGA